MDFVDMLCKKKYVKELIKMFKGINANKIGKLCVIYTKVPLCNGHDTY